MAKFDGNLEAKKWTERSFSIAPVLGALGGIVVIVGILVTRVIDLGSMLVGCGAYLAAIGAIAKK